MLVNLQAKAISPQHSRSQIHTENIQNKMTSLWQKKNMDSKKIDFSPKEKNKINKFIDELKSKEDRKVFFSHVFKTMITLGRDEKQNFITGVSQILQSSSDPELVSLNKKFNRSLSHYMAISLMSAPLSNQLRHNMTNINLEGNDNEEDELLI
ncbi:MULTISPECIES: hypothetical protein [Providencia]|uniref:Uncharacterized protein n=2 Tax=Morganellaceae TaxID=1903414 RepID=A0AB35LHH9_PRORE|nr:MULTISPECIES: hypothetical protein [Providencia]EHZ7766048.1 hypothetical protein [Providencia rettgeri]EIJ7169190.1 hypothetical protein [Providencia rettgeri]EJD6048061.1 hypothetical protein [Providencia rettgeri]EJD6476226.1 hypothetical protein [Providencia rettgeri]ELR5066151.1 hypothetical protein [Providencia rettgeri]